MGTKTATRETLVLAATALFLRKGLASVSMEEIAADAGCTRRNLYRYYRAKEDLAVDVVIALLDDWNAVQTAVYEAAVGTAAQRLRTFLDGLVAVLDGKRDVLRFLGEFDFVFRDAAAYHPDPERADRFQTASHVTEAFVEQLLTSGQADGSLVLPAAPAILVPTLTTVLWGLAQRVALRDSMIREEFGVSGLDLVRTQVALTLRALAPQRGDSGGSHENV